jgi:hypothetical protein
LSAIAIPSYTLYYAMGHHPVLSYQLENTTDKLATLSWRLYRNAPNGSRENARLQEIPYFTRISDTIGDWRRNGGCGPRMEPAKKMSQIMTYYYFVGRCLFAEAPAAAA